MQNGQWTLTVSHRDKIHTNLTSLLPTLLWGPGVDNLWYVPFRVGDYTDIHTVKMSLLGLILGT